MDLYKKTLLKYLKKTRKIGLSKFGLSEYAQKPRFWVF